jgi:hypothetical protein
MRGAERHLFETILETLKAIRDRLPSKRKKKPKVKR